MKTIVWEGGCETIKSKGKNMAWSMGTEKDHLPAQCLMRPSDRGAPGYAALRTKEGSIPKKRHRMGLETPINIGGSSTICCWVHFPLPSYKRMKQPNAGHFKQV